MSLVSAIVLLCTLPNFKNIDLQIAAQVSCQHYYIKCLAGKVDEPSLLNCAANRLKGQIKEEE